MLDPYLAENREALSIIAKESPKDSLHIKNTISVKRIEEEDGDVTHTFETSVRAPEIKTIKLQNRSYQLQSDLKKVSTGRKNVLQQLKKQFSECSRILTEKVLLMRAEKSVKKE